jgi:hypothetical protein
MIGLNDLLHHFPGPNFKTTQIFLTYFPNCPLFNTIYSCVPNVAPFKYLPQIYVQLLVKTACILRTDEKYEATWQHWAGKG